MWHPKCAVCGTAGDMTNKLVEFRSPDSRWMLLVCETCAEDNHVV